MDAHAIPGYSQASARYENQMPPEPTPAQERVWEQEQLDRAEALSWLEEAMADLGVVPSDLSDIEYPSDDWWREPTDAPVTIWLGQGASYKIHLLYGGGHRAEFASAIKGVDCD